MTWYAGSHGADGGNNTGWAFADPPAASASTLLRHTVTSTTNTGKTAQGATTSTLDGALVEAAAWYTGRHTTDAGNNAGWTFADAPAAGTRTEGAKGGQGAAVATLEFSPHSTTSGASRHGGATITQPAATSTAAGKAGGAAATFTAHPTTATTQTAKGAAGSAVTRQCLTGTAKGWPRFPTPPERTLVVPPQPRVLTAA